MNTIKIMIIGDFLIFRHGLRLLLEAENHFRVVGEANDLVEASLVSSKIRPDLILIESAEIDGGDFDMFRSSLLEPTPILVLTNSRQEDRHQEYLELGVHGIFSKGYPADDLFKAVKQVSAGDLWFRRKLIVETVQQLVRERKALPEHIYSYNCASLTSREREVLVLICQGMKNKAIADSLFITETTVRHHLTSIFEKLKVTSRLELVVHAFSEKLVEIPNESNRESTYVPEASAVGR